MELALLVPAIVLVLGLLIAGGRVWFARTTVVEAAQTAARSASLARSPADARASGQDAGRQSLATAGLACESTAVSIDTRGFAAEVGTPATVTSNIRCVVPLADLLLPAIPGRLELDAAGSAAIDTYRAR